MSETTKEPTFPKKMVSLNIAIALGIICVLLIAVIAYFTVTGISATNSYNNLQNQNKQLQAWLDGNETVLNQTQMWLTGNETLLNQIQNNNTSLQNTLNLNESTVLLNNYTIDGAPYSEGWNYSLNYAGYLFVSAVSTVGGTIELSYTFQTLNYDSQMDFNTGNGTAIFPVLPSSTVWLNASYTGAIPLSNDIAGPLVTTINATYYY